MKEHMWDLKVRTATSNSMFVKNCAQGIWGSKKLRKRTLTGVTKAGAGGVQKRKATPRKVEAVKGELVLLLILIKWSNDFSLIFIS